MQIKNCNAVEIAWWIALFLLFYWSSSFSFLPHLVVSIYWGFPTRKHTHIRIRTILQHFPFDTVHAPAQIYQIRVNYEIYVCLSPSVSKYVYTSSIPLPHVIHFSCSRFFWCGFVLVLYFSFLLLLFSSSCHVFLFLFYQLVFPFCLYQKCTHVSRASNYSRCVF